MSVTRSNKKQHKVEVEEESFAGSLLALREETEKKIATAQEALSAANISMEALKEALGTLA